MEEFNRIFKIIDINIIFCLIPTIITLLLIEKLFPNKFKTREALNVIRWTIILYTFLNFLYFIFAIIMFPEKHAFLNRATGPYAFAYWTMTFGAIILPMTLLYKRLGINPFYLIMVSFLMKSGVYFERFVIIVTTLHRDYLPSNNSNYSKEIHNLIFEAVSIIFLQGSIIAILTLLIITLFDKYKSINF